MRLIMIAVCTLLASPLAAATITSPGTFTPTQAIVDFEAFAVGTTGPITVDGMTISASSPQKVRAQGYTQYADIFEGQYFGFASVTYTIDFAVDVTHVGFGLFDPNLSGIDIQALDRNGNILESFEPPTGNIGGVFSTYVGFARATGDIASVRVVPPSSGDLIAIDSIGWAVAPITTVPLPASGLLLVAGLGSIMALRRRRDTRA